MKLLRKFTLVLPLFGLSLVVAADAMAQQAAPAQAPPRPADGKTAERGPATLAIGWRAVSTRQPGETLKIKLKDGGMVKGEFNSASDGGLVLGLKKKELSLNREEIASVSLLGKKSAGKATAIGIAVGGGVGAGAGAGIGVAAFGGGGFCCPRGKSAAVGAGILGGAGAIAGGLIGFAAGHAGRRETTIYEVLPAK
jgi:hypothetical protein